MRIEIDSQLANVKNLDELLERLTRLFEKLQQDLKNQPEFLVVTSDDQEISENTPANTIVFRMDETDIVKTGFFDGKDIILPP